MLKKKVLCNKNAGNEELIFPYIAHWRQWCIFISIDENDIYFTVMCSRNSHTLEFIISIEVQQMIFFPFKKSKLQTFILVEVMSILQLKFGMIFVNECITCVCVYILCILFSFNFKSTHHHRCTFQTITQKKSKWHFMMFWLWWAVLLLQCSASKKNQQKFWLTSTYANINANLFMVAIYVRSNAFVQIKSTFFLFSIIMLGDLYVLRRCCCCCSCCM